MEQLIIIGTREEGRASPKFETAECHANDPSFQMPWMKNGIYMY